MCSCRLFLRLEAAGLDGGAAEVFFKVWIKEEEKSGPTARSLSKHEQMHKCCNFTQYLRFLTSTCTGPLTLLILTLLILTPSQVSTDEKVKSDGCIAAFQTDTDKTSQRQSDRLITVMYLNVCVSVCV